MLGGECVQCGSTEALEIDHIDPGYKSYTITSRWNRGIAALRPELKKCQLLCSPCHQAKTVEFLGVEHGGGASGKKNCKCEPCRAKKQSYMLEFNAGRKVQPGERARTWRHGTLGGYRHCRCDECRAAKAAYNRQRYQLSRQASPA